MDDWRSPPPFLPQTSRRAHMAIRRPAIASFWYDYSRTVSEALRRIESCNEEELEMIRLDSLTLLNRTAGRLESLRAARGATEV